MTEAKSLPTFFLSYARQDAEKVPRKVERLFRDLEKEIANRAGLNLKEGELGAIDRRAKHGKGWPDYLGDALKSNKALIAIMTPLYFNRENCGKEVTIFVHRCGTAKIDNEGFLRDVENIFPIRWLDKTAFRLNGDEDGAIPEILRGIEDRPADNDDPDLARAIDKYVSKGMELCVKPKTDYYRLLLRSFADRIREMPELARLSFDVDFSETENAFDIDWKRRLPPLGGDAPTEPRPPASIPSGLGSLAAFYLTTREMNLDPRPVSFADRLVDEPMWRQTRSTLASGEKEDSPKFLSLVHQAAVREDLDVFHCVCEPRIPDDPSRLVRQLQALNKRNVIVLLFIDPLLWPADNPRSSREAQTIDQVVVDLGWSGPAIVPLWQANDSVEIEQQIAVGRWPRFVSVTRGSRDAIVNKLRRIISGERGRIMRTGEVTARARGEGSERPPVLQGVGGVRR